MFIDFEYIKGITKERKDFLRNDSIYGHNPLLIRSVSNNYTSGINKGVFDWGYISGSYSDNIVYGIKEYVPKGIEKRYNGLVVSPDIDIKFSTDLYSGTLIQAAIENNNEIWLDVTISGGEIKNTTQNFPSGANKCELVSFNDDLLGLERIFWFNTSKESN
jgi:hypothetical protein